MANEYDIARPTGTCAATGEPIRVGDLYVAVLLDRDGDAGPERRDYSLAAWEKGVLAELKPTGRVLGHWRAVMPEPKTAGRRLIDDDALLDLFEQSVEGDGIEAPGGGGGGGRAAFRYLLALILIRKRLLRCVGERAGTLHVRFAKDASGRTVEVPDPGLDEARIQEATEHLSSVLMGDPTDAMS